MSNGQADCLRVPRDPPGTARATSTSQHVNSPIHASATWLRLLKRIFGFPLFPTQVRPPVWEDVVVTLRFAQFAIAADERPPLRD